MKKLISEWVCARLWLAAALMTVTSISLSPVTAQEATEEKQEEKKSDDDQDEEEVEEEDPYEIPENASVEELVEFIKSVQSIRITSRKQFMEHRQKAPKAVRSAAKLIIEGMGDEEAVAFANEQVLMLDIQQLPTLKADRQVEIFEHVKSKLSDEELGPNSAQMAFQVAMGLENSFNKKGRELAKDAYKTFGTMLAKSDDEQIASMGERMQGVLRRLELVGNSIELSGTLMDGNEFNISSLKGKVVLVDFWATWCGPCIAEHPNIKKNYERFHEKGFEVVGISLDRDRKALEKYLEKEDVKWITLHEEDGSSPAADHYGVMGIPTMFLVGRDGNVISITARGKALTKLLEKEFGEEGDKPEKR